MNPFDDDADKPQDGIFGASMKQRKFKRQVRVNDSILNISVSVPDGVASPALHAAVEMSIESQVHRLSVRRWGPGTTEKVGPNKYLYTR